MAKLSQEEINGLKARGLYVTEKCDNCNKPILEPIRYVGKGASKKEVWCSVCATGATMGKVVEQNETKMEGTDMAKKEAGGKKQAVVAEKILGAFRAGTPMGDLAEALQDEKPHKLESILPAIRKKYKLADGWRGIGPLKSTGEKKGLYGVIFDREKGTIQIKLGKPSAKKVEEKPKGKAKPVEEVEEKAEAPKQSKKATKAASKPNGKVAEPEEEEPATSKQQVAVGRLVRGTLKNGKDWTRNKLIEFLKSQHQIDEKRTGQAIDDEISKGGISVEDGLLSLS